MTIVDTEASLQTETPDTVVTDSVGRDALMQRCRDLELAVSRRLDITADMIAAKAPGGALNSDTSAMGWLSFLCDLHRWHAAGPVTVLPTIAPMPRWSDREAEDYQALTFDTPVHVPLSSGKKRGVYPKGDFAIDRVAMIDRALQWLVPRRVAVEASEGSPESIEAFRTIVQLQHQLEREFVWIVTHPGPDVPWDDDGRWEYAAPKWTRAYGGHDLLLLRAAYIEVNYRRSNVIAERTRAMAGQSIEEASHDSFTGLMASELGISSVEIVHKWSRGSYTAIAFTKWETLQRARERAEAQ